jgi:hypothetical protein
VPASIYELKELYDTPGVAEGKRQGHDPRIIPTTLLLKQHAAAPNVDQITNAKIPKQSFVFSRNKIPSTMRHDRSSELQARTCRLL